MPSGIFISYRRNDSAGHAGRIYDRLEEFYGAGKVFRDIEDIGAGDDFVQKIRTTIDQYDVMLVIIGPTWLKVMDSTGRRRLDNPDDIVRLEVAAALERPNVRVIPVLVNGAVMPSAGELPPALNQLAQRNAQEILDTRFADDVERLISSLGGKRAGWLRKTVVTVGAAAVVAIAAGMVIIPFLTAAEIAADVTLYDGGGELEGDGRQEITYYEVPPDSTNPPSETPINEYRAPLTVTYDYERVNDNEILVSSSLPYRDLVKAGGPIEGGAATLFWDWPALSVKVVNTSERVIQLSEIQLEVRESQIDADPIVMVRQMLWRRTVFGVVNYGWGAMLNPVIAIAITRYDDCGANDWLDLPRQPVDTRYVQTHQHRYTGVESSESGAPGVEMTYSVGSMVPRALLRESLACVFGTISYDIEAEESHTVRFKTLIMINGSAPNAGVTVSEEFLIFLEAGRSGYTKSIPIALEVPAGSVEHFLMRLGTDRSASFDMSVSLRAVGEDVISADDVRIDILTPVYDPFGLRSQTRRR